MLREINPYNFGDPVPPERFVGRKDQAQKLIMELSRPNGQSCALIGGRRFGKSSFLNYIQHVLFRKLNEGFVSGAPDFKDGFPVLFPVLLSMKSLPIERSSEAVYWLILNRVYELFTDSSTQIKLGINEQVSIKYEALKKLIYGEIRLCSFEDFQSHLEEVVSQLFDSLECSIRLVILLDEIDEVARSDWASILFGNLRELLSQNEIKDSIRCIVSGSSAILDLREEGSPFLNMLDPYYLESISDDSICEIVMWAGQVPDEVCNKVIQFCGGHPFIAQYLMKRLFDQGLTSATNETVEQVVRQYFSERHSDLETWERDVGQTGFVLYAVLVEDNDWVTLDEIKNQTQGFVTGFDSALKRLSYHGFIIHDGTWDRYCYRGEIFKHWFLDNNPLESPKFGSWWQALLNWFDNQIVSHLWLTYLIMAVGILGLVSNLVQVFEFSMSQRLFLWAGLALANGIILIIFSVSARNRHKYSSKDRIVTILLTIIVTVGLTLLSLSPWASDNSKTTPTPTPVTIQQAELSPIRNHFALGSSEQSNPIR